MIEAKLWYNCLQSLQASAVSCQLTPASHSLFTMTIHPVDNLFREPGDERQWAVIEAVARCWQQVTRERREHQLKPHSLELVND